MSSNEELVAQIKQASGTQRKLLTEKLVVKNMNLVRHVAHKITIPGVDFDDRMQDGLMGMIEAIDTYDETQSKFSTHAVQRIYAKILRQGNEQANMIRTPSNVTELRMRIFKFMREYTASTGKRPSSKFVADSLDINIENVKFIMSAHNAAPMSIDATIDSAEGDQLSISDIFGGNTLENEMWGDERIKIITDFIDELPEWEQMLVSKVIGLETGEAIPMRTLALTLKNEHGVPVNVATISIRYNHAMKYIKARINGEQIVYNKTIAREVKPQPITTIPTCDVILCMSLSLNRVFITTDIKYANKSADELLVLFKELPDAVNITNQTDVQIIHHVRNVKCDSVVPIITTVVSILEDSGIYL